jgi:hypothetical protein
MSAHLLKEAQMSERIIQFSHTKYSLQKRKQKQRAGRFRLHVAKVHAAQSIFPLPSLPGKGILILRCGFSRCVGGGFTCAGAGEAPISLALPLFLFHPYYTAIMRPWQVAFLQLRYQRCILMRNGQNNRSF